MILLLKRAISSIKERKINNLQSILSFKNSSKILLSSEEIKKY